MQRKERKQDEEKDRGGGLGEAREKKESCSWYPDGSEDENRRRNTEGFLIYAFGGAYIPVSAKME